jgi:hypothetical protein
MIDISKQTVNLKCPNCKRSITASLNQVADEETVKCTCGQEIQLIDNNHSSRAVIHDINKSFKDLENTLKKIGR